jgi:hypothetical protein
MTVAPSDFSFGSLYEGGWRKAPSGGFRQVLHIRIALLT